jgi:hypothetical protein
VFLSFYLRQRYTLPSKRLNEITAYEYYDATVGGGGAVFEALAVVEALRYKL